MYGVCSFYRCCKVRLVCPMYERLQVLQVSLYMPLLSCSVLCLYGGYCSNCCMVFAVLYVICRFVRLNRLHLYVQFCLFVCFWRNSPQWTRASSFTTFINHTQRRTRDGRTPLDEWSALRRDLYLTTCNTHNRLTFMSSVGFEPTISTAERPQNYVLDGAATGTGMCNFRSPDYWISLLRALGLRRGLVS